MSEALAWSGRAAPALEAFVALAEAAFADLPEAVRELTGDVVFRVQEFAEPEILDDLGLEDPFELSGLYQGVSRMDRSVFASGTLPSTVFLYRRPILDEWAELGDVTLGDLITHVLIHEIGHHFGLSDADIEAIQAD
jgi:predicted Zn-dependent protease with MMP-like domain